MTEATQTPSAHSILVGHLCLVEPNRSEVLHPIGPGESYLNWRWKERAVVAELWLVEGARSSNGLRLCFLALYAVGPAVALWALLQRGFGRSTPRHRVEGWRWYVPTILLPIEWLLPPALILLGFGEIQCEWLAVRYLGLTFSLGGAALLIWASSALGRFLVHEAAVFQDHVLITRGPYRFLRHPVYSAYLALLLGSGVGMLNVYLLLLWPLSLFGILVQARSEDRLLKSKFGRAYRRYAGRTGQFVPRLGSRPSNRYVSSMPRVGVAPLSGESPSV